jgi:hypothetical protein
MLSAGVAFYAFLALGDDPAGRLDAIQLGHGEIHHHDVGSWRRRSRRRMSPADPDDSAGLSSLTNRGSGRTRSPCHPVER